MRRYAIFTVLLGALLSWSATALATVYDLDSTLGLSVTGSITTNGVLGELSVSDILDWQFTQTADSTHFVGSMGSSNSTVSLTGAALKATPTQLLFDFGGISGSKLAFSSSNFGVNGGISLQFCNAVTACLNQNNASSFSTALLVLVAPGCCSTSGGVAQSPATTQIAVAASVPEPETYSMILAGLFLLGFATNQRKK